MTTEKQRWLVRLEYRLADDEEPLPPGDKRLPMLDTWLRTAYGGGASPLLRGWIAWSVVTADANLHFIEEAEILGVKHIEDCVKFLELPRCAVVAREVTDADTAEGSDIYGSRELAELLGISRQRLLQLRGAGIAPAPDVELAATPVWWRSTVERFIWEWQRRSGPKPKGVVGGQNDGMKY